MSTTVSPTVTVSQPVEPAAAESEKKKSEPRPYVVLRNVTEKPTSPGGATPQTWEFVRNVTAGSVEQAIGKVVEILVAASEDSSFSGQLVAIPARNFRPKPVEIEIKTRIKIG